MSSWARRAADISSVVTSCGHPGTSAPDYIYRLEKVKFGVPLEEVCKNNDNIPGPLLVLILKLNKESPNRRDVFRAPGHQGAMKKLIHFLQAGRLVNVDNYSVYTIASVLKKFLRKIPNGIFGRSGENELFDIIDLDNELEQMERLHRLFTSLPKYTQRLLVLLFGTFRVIASNATQASTGMTSEALGVSVAPSFFQSCVSDGKTARMEDVLKFKVATKIMKQIIDKFATHDLFGRENYEYYARVTGRILKVQDDWICSFQYPPPPRGKLAQQKYALQHSLEAEKTWLQCQCERWGLQGPGLFAMTSSPIPKRNLQDLQQQHQRDTDNDADVDEENFDYDDVANDDDDDNDALDFAAEFELSNDDEDFENNPKKISLPRTFVAPAAHHQRIARITKTAKSTATTVAASNQPTDRSAVLNTTYTIGVDNVDGSNCGVGVVAAVDSNDDDEVTVVRRRYRQNTKKKILTQTRMQQHQRRLRAGTKSLDGGAGAGGGCGDHEQRLTQQTTTMNEMKNNKKQNSTTTQKEVQQMTTDGARAGGFIGSSKMTTRTCSRCNRGIRHSSSCSSASGGGAGAGGGGGLGSGSGMTMEELRAVNRYAESTKSLSYLPQVHERQTARMRTRSEWFLGPRDSELTLNLPNTCSNCCLAAVQQQQQQYDYQQQQQYLQFPQHSYLGGGSTRDMRTHRTADVDDDDENSLVIGGSGGGGGSGGAVYTYYKKRLQQQQRNGARQLLQAEQMMDTDDIGGDNTYCDYGATRKKQRQQQQFLQVDTANLHLGRRMPALHAVTAAQNGSEGRRIYLDVNTAAAAAPTTTKIATTTTTKPITAHYDLLLHHRSDNHYHHHHDHEHHHCHYPPCPRNSIADSSSSYPIQRSQPHQHHHHPQRRCTANQTATQERRYSSMLLPNHYHSTDSVPYCDVDLVVDIVEDDVQTPSSLPSLSPARLYFSPRKQIVATTNKRRYKSTLDLYKSTFDHDDDDFDAEYKEHQDVNDKHQAHNSDFEHNYFTCCTPLPSSEYLNFSDFDATSPPPHTSSMLCEAFNDDSVSFLKSSTLIDSSAASSSAAPTASIKTAAPLSMPLAAAEEVDFIQTSRYRQSTPRIHRRQHQLVRRRQRLTSSSSNSTQYQSLNSTSVSNVGGTAAAGGGGGSGGNGVGNTLRTESGGNNFVTIIFNVLDFLF
ncbi:uncharacterized protein RhoGAP71E isoform X2 [Eurosta solidaginis]|uniref:uncharacterized protein RhoGAP71E isoform X2 n=1 Tax=Eurosta solidaginis TaxID=178769 RepID=UPI003530B127